MRSSSLVSRFIAIVFARTRRTIGLGSPSSPSCIGASSSVSSSDCAVASYLSMVTPGIERARGRGGGGDGRGGNRSEQLGRTGCTAAARARHVAGMHDELLEAVHAFEQQGGSGADRGQLAAESLARGGALHTDLLLEQPDQLAER